MWKVIVDYDASLAIDEQDTVDTMFDKLAEDAGEVLESGSGSGFGRRDLDYAFRSEAEAARLARSIEAAFRERVDLDLMVRAIDLNETLDS